jgi:hypothetical protein
MNGDFLCAARHHISELGLQWRASQNAPRLGGSGASCTIFLFVTLLATCIETL